MRYSIGVPYKQSRHISDVDSSVYCFCFHHAYIIKTGHLMGLVAEQPKHFFRILRKVEKRKQKNPEKIGFTKTETNFFLHIVTNRALIVSSLFRLGVLGFKKNSLFPYRSEKKKMSSMKLKIKSLFFIQ